MNEILREYVKIVLSEGKYDSFVRKLTQQILSHVKNTTETLSTRWDVVWPFSGQFEGRKLTVAIEYTINTGDETDMYVDAAAGQYRSFSGLTPFIKVNIDVTTNKEVDGIPDVRSMLRHININVQSAVAHELEHVLQFTWPNADSNRPGPEDRPDYDAEDPEQSFEYLTDPTEVAAHVRGYYLMAKRKRIPLGRVMKHAITQYEEMGHLSRIEASQVFVLWRKWALKNLPAADLETKKVASAA
jgi:hypothetical protein